VKYWHWFLLCAALTVGAEDVPAPVTGAMIFKNGVSAVRRSMEPGKALEFDLACDIQPLQGSLWFSAPVVSVVRQEAKKPTAGTYPLDDVTKTFAGKQVTLLVTSANQTVREISGTIWDPAPKAEKGKSAVLHDSPSVWLKQADGSFEMIQRHRICGIRCAEQPRAAALPEQFDRRPVWHFTLERPAVKPVTVDYLTNGLQWQSAYRIELDKDRKMTISQDVEIVNHLADLKNVSLYLASGFANFLNQGNLSPMSMLQPTEEETVSAGQNAFGGVMRNQYAASDGMPREMMAPVMKMESRSFGEAATGETEDISLLPLPGFTLKKGEVCHKVIGSAEADYERLVHWSIGSRRNASDGQRNDADEKMLMDALRFTNPFSVPITTSPVEVRDGGMVLAQVKIPWVNPKQTATLDITRALSVTGKVLEYEVPPENTERAEQVFHSLDRNKMGKVTSGWIAGSRYRITDV